jgi:hypothetical protein
MSNWFEGDRYTIIARCCHLRVVGTDAPVPEDQQRTSSSSSMTFVNGCLVEPGVQADGFETCCPIRIMGFSERAGSWNTN